MQRQTPQVGAVVLYLLPTGPRMGEGRPATIVRVNPDNTVNLLVHLDGPNDRDMVPPDTYPIPPAVWVGTVAHRPAIHRIPGSYSWPPYNPPSEQE